jgi:hypothetical protein
MAATDAQTTASTRDEDKPFALFMHVHEKTSPKKVFAIFAKLGLGRLGREDGGEAIELTERTNSEGRAYKTAVVHFKHLFSRGADGEANRAAFEHLKASRDNYIEVEHMPEKVLDDGTVLPRRLWKPRLNRPRSDAGDRTARSDQLVFGTVKRAPRPQMLVTAEDWDGPRAAGVTEDEAREAVREVQAAAAAASGESAEEAGDGDSEEMTDEEYAKSVLAGGSA